MKRTLQIVILLAISFFATSCSKGYPNNSGYFVKYQAQGKGSCSYTDATGQTIKRAVGDLDVIIGPVNEQFIASVTVNITSGSGYCSIAISENNGPFVTVAESSVTWRNLYGKEQSARANYNLKDFPL